MTCVYLLSYLQKLTISVHCQPSTSCYDKSLWFISQKIYCVLDIIHFKLRQILSDLFHLMLICLQSANLAHQIKTQTKYDALLQVEDPDTAYTSLLTFNVIPYHHSISLFPFPFNPFPSSSVCWVLCNASKFSLLRLVGQINPCIFWILVRLEVETS